MSQSPYGSPLSFSPPPSPGDPELLHANHHLPKLKNHSYENVTINHLQESNSPRQHFKFQYDVEAKTPETPELRTSGNGSPYENVLHQNNTTYPQSPRTRIKTFVGSKDR